LDQIDLFKFYIKYQSNDLYIFSEHLFDKFYLFIFLAIFIMLFALIAAIILAKNTFIDVKYYEIYTKKPKINPSNILTFEEKFKYTYAKRYKESY
jgi:uncharacterized protein YneF (UPF0154 family)